jgi:hypothetical protein
MLLTFPPFLSETIQVKAFLTRKGVCLILFKVACINASNFLAGLSLYTMTIMKVNNPHPI